MKTTVHHQKHKYSKVQFIAAVPVCWDTQITDLAQVIHAVQHGKDLFGVPHEVRENIINVTWKTNTKNIPLHIQIYIFFVSFESISVCGVSVLTCSIADVAKNNVQISTKIVHLQNILPETDKGLMEETS